MREKLRFNAYKALMYVAFAVMSLVSTSAMAEVSYPELSTGNQTITLSIRDDYYDGNYWSYTFTTTIAGKYTFESSGNYDLAILAYDQDDNQIGFHDNIDSDNNNYNFHLELDLAAKTTYLIQVCNYSEVDELSYTMSVVAPCEHKNITYVAAKAATCAKAGNIAYYHCSDCGNMFSDAACTTNLTNVSTGFSSHDDNGNGICKTCGNEINKDYFTLTCTADGPTVWGMAYFGTEDGSGWGTPSSIVPNIECSINDGDWFNIFTSANNIFMNDEGYWVATSYGISEGGHSNRAAKKGDVLRFRGTNTSLCSYATGATKLLGLDNEKITGAFTVSGNPSSLFIGDEVLKGYDYNDISTVEHFVSGVKDTYILTCTKHCYGNDGKCYICGSEKPAAITANDTEEQKYTSTVTTDFTLNRNMTNDGWYTICLPFDIDIDDTPFTKVAEFNSTTTDNGTTTFSFITVDAIKAGEPYLVQVDKSYSSLTFTDVTIEADAQPAEKDVFQGIFSPTYIAEGYGIGSGNSINPLKAGTMKGFRAYFKMNSQDAKTRCFVVDDSDNVTAINAIDIDKDAEYGFSVTGQRVKANAKGIVIVNGKKVFNK